MSDWWQEYLGKPWEAVPNPPRSFTCGELIRYIYKERFGLSIPLIEADASRLRECVLDIDRPEHFGFHQFEGDVCEYDVAYFRRGVRRSHVGMAVSTVEGLGILHCQQGAGVILQSLASMLGSGFRSVEWRRFEGVKVGEGICGQ